MENKTIRIALSGVLIYLISKKSYNILTELLLWLNVELRIDNTYFLLAINIFIGLFAIGLLIVLYNRFLKKEHNSNRTVYTLLFITIFLTIIFAVINKLYGAYLANIDMEEFRPTYLFQFGWTNALEILFPVLCLIYFLWKLKTDNKTVANNI
ncbi:MAG: hypothetical protein ACQEWG_16365 [Bacteroidota bacterium]